MRTIDFPIQIEEVVVEYDGRDIDAAWMIIDGVKVQMPDELLFKLKPELYEAVGDDEPYTDVDRRYE